MTRNHALLYNMYVVPQTVLVVLIRINPYRTLNRSPLWFGRTYYPIWTNMSKQTPGTVLPPHARVDSEGWVWEITDGCGALKGLVLVGENASDIPTKPATGSECAPLASCRASARGDDPRAGCGSGALTGGSGE